MRAGRDGYHEIEQLRSRFCPPGDRNYIECWGDGVRRSLQRHKETVADLAVGAANMAQIVGDEPERLNDPLVGKAIRDTNPSFDFDAPPDGHELVGALNAAKGKYFEYLVAHRLNSGERVGDVVLPEGHRAELAESLSQPGWDLQILDETGHVADYLQLKATDNLAYVHQALERYPEITVLATTEVADGADVLNSAILDSDLEETVHVGMGVATPNFAEAFDPLIPLAFVLATEGYRLVLGPGTTDEARLGVLDRGTRTVLSQGVGALVFAAGGGWLAVPASLIAGGVYQRLAEVYEMTSFLQHSERQLCDLRRHQQNRIIASFGAHS